MNSLRDTLYTLLFGVIALTGAHAQAMEQDIKDAEKLEKILPILEQCITYNTKYENVRNCVKRATSGEYSMAPAKTVLSTVQKEISWAKACATTRQSVPHSCSCTHKHKHVVPPSPDACAKLVTLYTKLLTLVKNENSSQ